MHRILAKRGDFYYYRMFFPKTQKGQKAAHICPLRFFICTFIVLYLNRTLDPLVCDAATPRLRAEMTRVINEAVSEAMSDYDEKLINITYGSSGKILSVETDSVKINLLRALVTEKINEKIKSYSEYTITISFSNIMDDEIVFGRFPSWRIPASVEPNGSAETTVKSSLTSAGINQSLHKITLSVKVRITAMLLISTVDVETDTDICIAETVIIGEVPSVFLGKES